MDYVRDQNPRPLYRVDALAGTPDYVTQSPVITAEETEKLASVAFADPVKREFPCFDKVSTYLSYAYLRGQSSPRPELTARVRQAGEVFGITADLDRVDSALGAAKSASAPVRVFALPAGSVKEAKANFYPINDREEIEHAGRTLMNDRSRMPLQAFYTAARAIVKAASAIPGCVLPPRIERAGEDRYPDFNQAAKAAASRKFVVKDQEALELYAELVKAAESTSELDAEKFAQLWADLDGTYGVKYAHGILDPWAAIFSGPTKHEVEKLASTFTFIAGSPVPMDALNAIPEEKLRQRLTKTAADNLLTWRKLAAAEVTQHVSSLEMPVQKEILRLAAA
jgi:hypothetical protein